MSLHATVCFPTGRLILQGIVSSRSVFDALVHPFPLPSLCFGTTRAKPHLHAGRCLHHIIRAWLAPCPKLRPCLWCNQAHRLSATQGIISPPPVMMHGVEACPCHLLCSHLSFHFHGERRSPPPGSPDCGMDILNCLQSPKG